MLSEERMQELAEQFEERFSRVCLRILQDMGETLKKTEDLTPSQVKKLQQMFTYGADVQDMTKQLARAAGTSMEDIRKLYEQVAKEEQDWSKPFYDAKGVTQIPFAENELLQNIVKAAAAVTKGELRNMSRTTTVGIRTKNGFQPLGSFYKKTVDEAISAVATGTMDYNSTVRQAIKDMGSSGLRVQYESGYTRRLDSAIRQNIIDGVSYIAQETARQAGEEFGADGVELSAHSPCAPDHLPYQGKQYSLREYDDLQASLKRPIGEWNCRHFPYPILLGISRPANSRAELAEMERESNRKIEIDGNEYTRYECTQLQRKLETKLRYAREEKAIYQAAGQPDLVREATEKIRILGNKYKDVSEKAGLPTRAERMRTFARKKADGTRVVVEKVAQTVKTEKVEAIIKEFNPAKTIEEARQFGKTYSASGNFDIVNIKLDVVNGFNEAAFNVRQRYGRKLKINGIEPVKKVDSKYHQASYNPITQMIKLKNSSIATYRKNAEKFFSTGWNASKDKYGTFYHEIGHVVWEDLPSDAKADIRKIYSDTKHNSYQKWMEKGGRMSGMSQADIFGKELSRYAIENEQEFFSEAFSQIMSGRARPVSRKVSEVLNEKYKKSIETSIQDGIINTGGVSGAKKTPGWKDRHAELMYEEIRKRTTDCKKISENTIFTEKAVEEIKDHMFTKKHRFADGSVRMFDSDFEQAQAWDRLTKGTHTDLDVLMLKHEYVELTQMRLHDLVYEDAHEIANSKHNWFRALLNSGKEA